MNGQPIKVRIGGLDEQGITDLLNEYPGLTIDRETSPEHKWFGLPTPEYKVSVPDENTLKALLARTGPVGQCNG